MVTWPSHDNHATMYHPCHLFGRPPSLWTWDLRVPTLFLSNLFLSHCMLILLCLLHSGPTPACSHPDFQDPQAGPITPDHAQLCARITPHHTLDWGQNRGWNIPV